MCEFCGCEDAAYDPLDDIGMPVLDTDGNIGINVGSGLSMSLETGDVGIVTGPGVAVSLGDDGDSDSDSDE